MVKPHKIKVGPVSFLVSVNKFYRVNVISLIFWQWRYIQGCQGAVYLSWFGVRANQKTAALFRVHAFRMIEDVLKLTDWNRHYQFT
jgi:hypothetical protein